MITKAIGNLVYLALTHFMPMFTPLENVRKPVVFRGCFMESIKVKQWLENFAITLDYNRSIVEELLWKTNVLKCLVKLLKGSCKLSAFLKLQVSFC